MFLTEKEAAARLQCDPRTVRRLVVSGRLRAVDLGTTRRNLRIDPDALNAILPPPADPPVMPPPTYHRGPRSLPPAASTQAYLPSV